MFINKESIIATSYIGKDGDDKNQCFLSKESFFVRYKGRLEKFSLEDITDVHFKHKLYLLPIVIGGIISPFCLLAIVKAIGNPWYELSGMVAGLLLIYYGYEGSPAMSIVTRIKEFDFFIKKPTPNLLAFTKYTRQIFKFGEAGSLFYLNISGEQLKTLDTLGYIEFKEETPLYYYDEVLRSGIMHFAIDPKSVGSNFSLKTMGNKISPVISGKVAKEYILPADS